MSGIDAAIGTLVRQLLAGLGSGSGLNLTASCTLNVAQRNYDPLSGSAPAAVPAQFPLNCTPPDHFKQAQINGTSVKNGDFMIWVSAFELAALEDAPGEPDPGMTLTFGDRTYTIVSVEPTYVGSTAVLFGIQCRE